ncbi:MAG: DUF3395 domain-containing protein [Acidobacteria bacterium]|nr:DUF3395 domain-containing protein [Acidobacteriota bacterium]
MRIPVFSLFLSAVLLLQAQPPPAANNLEIIAAYYGTPDRFADVTARVQSMQGPNSPGGVTIPVASGTFGAPLGGPRLLRVYYRLNGRFHHGEWRDGDTVTIGTPGTASAAGTSANGSGELRILAATYGQGRRIIDVTSLLQGKVTGNRVDLQITNQAMGGSDPAPATVKELRVAYEYQGRRMETRVDENAFLRLPDAVVPMRGLYILSAHWGAPGRMANVTGVLANLVQDNRLDITVGNAIMGTDPARGADKILQLVYQFDGQRFETTVEENKVLSIPARGGTAGAAASANTVADGVCFYNEANFRGQSKCFGAGDNVPSMPVSSIGSVRLNGRVRTVEIYEGPQFQGKFVRIQANQPDLRQAAGGSTSAPNFWVTRPGSIRVSY